MDNQVLVTIGGALMLVGGLMQIGSIVKLRGRRPWRGPAISAVALVVYGALALAGYVLNGTALSAALIWFIAVAMWVGVWLTRRDAARLG